MTPYQIIQEEERKLVRVLNEKIGQIVGNLVQDFVDKTGCKINSIEFGFVDVSTIDRKQVILNSAKIYKEHV